MFIYQQFLHKLLLLTGALLLKGDETAPGTILAEIVIKHLEVLLEKSLILLLQIMVKLNQEAVPQMALQNVLGRVVVLLTSTHLCAVTVLHHLNALVVMVVEIFMEEVVITGKYLFEDTNYIKQDYGI